ncbi:uncharacterized protein HGUI_03905 [Hanseniaspora guilliermondii]|uniref:FYVE-type domain-containing protein n=1 Tax=Hanseniaspora guilliermondii TaxID=56406 RepID=A0A1L0B571_9ASCO|nr:uncharacterized protein HGUI_03905 [Hanseniaspora guilliermondii]
MKYLLFETYLATITGDNTSSELDLSKALEMSDALRSNSLPENQAKSVLIKKLKEYTGFNSNNKNKVLRLWQTIQIIMLNSGISFVKGFFYNIEFLRVLQTHLIMVEEKEKSGQLDDYKDLRNCLWSIYLDLKVYAEGMRIPPFTNITRILEHLEDRNCYPPRELVDNQETFDDLKKKFETKTPAEWIESENCLICDNQFSLFNRKHHCRNCGGVFCNDHSSHFIPLLELGITENVRVCDDCYKLHTNKTAKGGKRSKKHKDKRYIQNTFEEDLKKAIELSLKEAENSNVPDLNSVEVTSDEEVELPPEYINEDPEFKEAIILSLKEDKRREKEARLTMNKTHGEIVSKEPTPEPNNVNNEEQLSNKQLNQSIADLVFKMQEKDQTDEKTLDESISKAQKLKELIDKETNELERKYQMLKDLNNQVDSNRLNFDTNLENKFTEIRKEEETLESSVEKLKPIVFEDEDEEVNPYAKYYMNPVPEVKRADVPKFIKETSPIQRNVQESVLNQLDGLSFNKDDDVTTSPEVVDESYEPTETEALEKKHITKIDFPTVPLNKPPAKAVDYEEEEEEAPMLIEF